MFGSTQILPLETPPVDWNLGQLPPSQLTDHEEKEQYNSNQAPVAVATHTRPIGIIHPPPDIRTIIEKTAQYVLQYGLEFENKVKLEKSKDTKYSFLTRSDDHFHAFYQHKLAEYTARKQDIAQDGEDPKPDAAVEGEVCDAQPDLQAQFRIPPKPLESVHKYTVRLIEGITSEELDIIKLTSQFVARNGKSFLNGLQSRESNNPRFHFMKPTHSMFPLFTALVDAYFDLLKPPHELKEKLRKNCADLTTVLERCLHRVEWDRFQEQEREKDEDKKEKERVQMAMIDWHDFVVVDSIDFTDKEYEELPLAMTLEEVIRESKVSTIEKDEIVEPVMEVEMVMDEEEIKLVAEGLRAANREENVNDEEAPMRVVKNWKRPEDRMIPTERNPTKVVISPITGELFPINEMSEHMRISLIDPKFKEQKDRMFAKIRETTLAQDDEIAKNIIGLARLRPDIFGTTDQEVSNAVKAEIEKKKEPNQALTQNSVGEEQGNDSELYPNSFPGPAALPPPLSGVPTVWPLPPPLNLALNLPRPAPPSVQYPFSPRPLGVPMMQPMHQQDQLFMPCPSGHMMMNRPPQMQPVMPMPPPQGSHFAHLQGPRSYGQFPPPSVGMMQPPLIPGMSPPPPPPLLEEPEPKRQKLDELVLVPEDQFLAQHPGSATIRVSVPNVDDGKVIEFTLQSLSENVGSLKEKIAWGNSNSSKQTEVKWKSRVLKGQHVTCTLQCGSWRNSNTVFERTWWEKKIETLVNAGKCFIISLLLFNRCFFIGGQNCALLFLLSLEF